MRLTDQDAAELFREATARRPRDPQCLDEQLLLRASMRQLDARERERVAAHIAQCSDCAREYRVARAMRPFSDDARAAVGRRAPRWWIAAAAAVIVIALLAWQNATVRRQRGELDALTRQLQIERSHVVLAPAAIPQLGVPIVDLDPEPTRGGATPAPSIEVPKSTGEIALVLHLPPGTRAPAAVAIVDAHGSAIWRGTAAQSLDAGSMTLTLPRELIPSGSYTVRVGQTSFPFHVAWP